MTNLIKMSFVKRIGVMLLVLGTLFAATSASTFAQGRYYHRDHDGQNAAIIGGSAAAGAVIGALAGGGKGALIGGLIGAGGGTAIAVTRNHDRYYYDRGYYGGRYYDRDDYRFRGDRDDYRFRRDHDHDNWRGYRR
ncbi:MAG TPA: hypothetical protein VFC63_28865 [Blastocatellia bacterium]|nr:hypothetical protein [Blastocatellia bacterium]